MRLKIDNVPVYMGVTNNDLSSDLFFDQTWVECTGCGCIQLINLLPPSLLYQSNSSTEAVGQVWKDHHDIFSNFIAQDAPRKILEIGAAHGYLANKLTAELINSEYTIIEPDSNLVNSRIKIIKGYIEDHFSEMQDKDCIIHSHVLEHIYKPIDFINQISNHVPINADMYISFPNMDGFIKSGGLNSLNFEHTYLLDPAHAELIFENAGFSILKKESYLSHSYFYKLKKKEQKSKKIYEFPNIHLESMKFIKMVSTLKNFVSTTNEILDSHNGPVYLFGAHVFSQGLISLGLRIEKISGILDNSKAKQSQRLYGTPLKVFDPSIILGGKNIAVVLNASHYQSEIRDQLISINKHITIIENS
jgi:2-polyprenyl-3-methyl-5-hydroxy-6-metoxy-1,4-benzoquinol methylase